MCYIPVYSSPLFDHHEAHIFVGLSIWVLYKKVAIKLSNLRLGYMNREIQVIIIVMLGM
jgi:hypothetical protein